MRVLSTQRGVTEGDVTYPYGRIVNDETYLDEEILADLVYSMNRLLDLTSITNNDLPENTSNGYQIIEALKLYGRENLLVDRGDPSSYDYNQGTLTLDGTWRELDLSSAITGVGVADAKYALIRIHSTTNNVAPIDGISFGMRKDDNANIINASYHYNVTQVAATIVNTTDHWVALKDRKIEYNGTLSGNGITGMGLVVAGWQF